MSNFLRLVIFALAGFLLFLLSRLLVYGYFLTSYFTRALVLSFVFSGMGFLAGLIVYELKLRPAKLKNLLFLISHTLFLLLFTAASLYFMIRSKRPVKRDYAKENRNAFNFFSSENQAQIRTGYELFVQQFKDSNAYSLTRMSSTRRDTTIGNSTGEGQQLVFTYRFIQQPGILYYSKIFVLHNNAYLQSHLKRLENDPESQEIKQAADSTNRAAGRIIDEASRVLDSLRKVPK